MMVHSTPPASPVGVAPREAHETVPLAVDRVTVIVSTILLKMPASDICVVSIRVAFVELSWPQTSYPENGG